MTNTCCHNCIHFKQNSVNSGSCTKETFRVMDKRAKKAVSVFVSVKKWCLCIDWKRSEKHKIKVL